MARFINPFTDIGFKKIFGQEVSKELIIDFLNDLLEGERSVSDIRFLDKELLPEVGGDRGAIYDIFCISDTGEYFIVEMQNIRQVNFAGRALYYLSRAIVRQAERGEQWQFDLKAVYGVFFVNFRLHDTPGKLRSDIVLADRDTHEQFSDKLRFIFIELPSFTKEESGCETDFDKWIYVLKNMETLERIPFKNRKAVFEKLEQMASKASMTKKEREIYENSLDVYRDNLATATYVEQAAELAMTRGLAEGMEKGMAEGMEKGMAEGMEKGREEGDRNRQLTIAGNLKARGLPVDLIAETTGLSAEEIEKL